MTKEVPYLRLLKPEDMQKEAIPPSIEKPKFLTKVGRILRCECLGCGSPELYTGLSGKETCRDCGKRQ